MAEIPVTWDGSDANGNPLRWDSGLKWNGFLPQPKPTKMSQLRVLLSFAKASDHALEETANSVHTKLYGNAVYPSPPVTALDLQAAITAFTLAIAAADQGGPEDTADKNEKREVLIELLRKLAEYVQEKHNNILSDLLSSGFEAVSTNRAAVPLETPSIKDIVNQHTGQLKVRIQTVPNARAYEVRYALIAPDGTPGAWMDGGIFTDSRQLIVPGLTPGANYLFAVRGIGGSTQYSDWSNPVSRRSL